MNRTLSIEIFKGQTKHLTDERLLKERAWIVNEINYPIIDITFQKNGRKSLRVRMKCDDYDSLPPSIELLADDGTLLEDLPKGSGVLNSGKHPITKRPFICTPGSLEYHTHSSHISDKWENYKGNPSFDLGGILTQIFYAWGKTTD